METLTFSKGLERPYVYTALNQYCSRRAKRVTFDFPSTVFPKTLSGISGLALLMTAGQDNGRIAINCKVWPGLLPASRYHCRTKWSGISERGGEMWKSGGDKSINFPTGFLLRAFSPGCGRPVRLHVLPDYIWHINLWPFVRRRMFATIFATLSNGARFKSRTTQSKREGSTRSAVFDTADD